MSVKTLIETEYARQTDDFAASVLFQDLEHGAARREVYDDFIRNICRTHLKSPHIVAFLYAVAPPLAADNLKHNLLEELGLDDAAGVSHPALLHTLARDAGFSDAARRDLENLAQEELRRIVTAPVLFGTLKEIGLNVLLETIAFEWMLSRLAGRIAAALAAHRGLAPDALAWFSHHSEVDIRHAEEGLEAIADYVSFYEFESSEVELILEITFRENVFSKRYFGEIAAARQTGMLN